MSGLPSIIHPQALVRTRIAWHSLAEHVLARATFDTTGRIGLRVTPGGYGTPPYERRGVTEALHIVGTELRVMRGDATAAHRLTTLADAARAADVELGAPPNVYTPVTPLDPHAPLVVDVDAARVLAAWFELGWSVLDDLRQLAGDEATPSGLTLWPEHFDAAIELGNEELGARGTFGISPGDGEHPEPYAYVTHWADVPDDDYWNDTAFPGASLPYATVAAATSTHETMLDFFRAGLALISAPR